MTGIYVVPVTDERETIYGIEIPVRVTRYSIGFLTFHRAVLRPNDPRKHRIVRWAGSYNRAVSRVREQYVLQRDSRVAEKRKPRKRVFDDTIWIPARKRT
jgi:hypothetical protein